MVGGAFISAHMCLPSTIFLAPVTFSRRKKMVPGGVAVGVRLRQLHTTLPGSRGLAVAPPLSHEWYTQHSVLLSMRWLGGAHADQLDAFLLRGPRRTVVPLALLQFVGQLQGGQRCSTLVNGCTDASMPLLERPKHAKAGHK